MTNKYRNFFHIEPEKGLMNDPNGLIQFKGKYYFFFQWNRFNTNHSYKEWGLFTSTNLLEWDDIGSAVIPDSIEDKDGVYSGSAIEHEGNLHLFYTGNTMNDGERKSYIKQSISVDGKTFIKQREKLKVPEGYTEHFRDPKVWRGEGKWMMIVGGQTKNNEGVVLLFSSSDLKKWKFVSEFYRNNSLNQMAECPDYFKLDENIEILTVCPQKRTDHRDTDLSISSYAGYIKGSFNQKEQRFIPNTDINIIDYGFDFYAPQSFIDNLDRRIMVGWMSRMDDEEEELAPTVDDNYLHCLTMPRELKWKNNILYQTPLKEFENLRKEKIDLKNGNKSIENISKAYELIVLFNQTPKEFSVTLNDNDITFKENKLIVSRLNWVDNKLESKEIIINNINKLHFFCDTSTMELFINDGQYVFSMRFFNTKDDYTINFDGLTNKDTVTYYSY